MPPSTTGRPIHQKIGPNRIDPALRIVSCQAEWVARPMDREEEIVDTVYRPGVGLI